MSSSSNPSVIALIPARSGSKRVVGKNIRLLDGHPLMAYAISAALESEIFDAVVVSTDSETYAHTARRYGAEVPFLRPAELAGEVSPDIEWVRYTLERLRDESRIYQCFSILRPTSPFRMAGTIRRAWSQFLACKTADSLRAVEKCKQHPGKMWVMNNELINPLLNDGPSDQPWHSTPYQALPPVYVQNASLEIAWSRVPLERGTIAGNTIAPFVTDGMEGFDINDRFDWIIAEYLLAQGEAKLPTPRFENHSNIL